MGATACYFQFNSPQLKAQSEFLTNLFDWTVEGDDDHAFFNHGGEATAINGDIEPTNDELPTGLILYWEVEDLQEKCDQAVALGGSVVTAPTDLPNNYGSIALIRDLDGNILGLYRRPLVS